MGAAVDARAEDLGRLGIPEDRPVGGAHHHAVFHDLQRIHRRMCHNGAVGIEVALHHVDGVLDEIRRHERSGAIVQHHVLVLVAHHLEPRKRRLLTNGPRGREHHGRDEGKRVDGAGQVLVHTLLGAHDDDEPHIAYRVEGLGRPREDGLAGNLHQLLATFFAEALPCATSQNDSRRLGLFVHFALQLQKRRAQGIEIELIHAKRRLAKNRGLGDGIDDVRHKSSHGDSVAFERKTTRARSDTCL